MSTLGQTIRAARKERRLSLRELARRIDKTPTYLCDIEYDRRVPAAETVRALAAQLEVDPGRLFALAGRLDPDVADYLRRTPLAVLLLRRMVRHDLDAAAIAALLETAETMAEGEGSG